MRANDPLEKAAAEAEHDGFVVPHNEVASELNAFLMWTYAKSSE